MQSQQCSVVKQLTAQKAAVVQPSTFSTRVFAFLFPGSPRTNSLLATLYISGPPNLLLALCPPNIDPGSLSIMVAFAVGGLLGDTLFHLLPEIFLGEDSPDSVRFVMVEGNRNLLLGAAILVGIVTFMSMDKIIRIASGGQEHSHSHSHHTHEEQEHTATATATESTSKSNVRRRKGSVKKDAPQQDIPKNPSVKLSGYLNLVADFTHNITDGLALSSSFYASPTIGATTAVAVFFHEIPHEVGDFALLIQSGFSKRAAMSAQFVTAIGALLGTLLGIVIQESSDTSHSHTHHGLFHTGLDWGDLLLPFTAGTFLYVGTVAVIPELLETSANKPAEVRKYVTQLLAMAAGAGIML